MERVGVLQKVAETAQKGNRVQVADFNGVKIFVQPESKVYIEPEALDELISDFSYRIAETSGFLIGHKDAEGSVYLTHYQKMTGIIRRRGSVGGFSKTNIENNLANLERSYLGKNVLFAVHFHHDIGKDVAYYGLSKSMTRPDDATAMTFREISKKYGFDTMFAGYAEIVHDTHTNSPAFLLNLFDYSDPKEKKPIGYSLCVDSEYNLKHRLKAHVRNRFTGLMKRKEEFFASHRQELEEY